MLMGTIALTIALSLTGPVLNFNGTDDYLSGHSEELRMSSSTPFTMSLGIYPRRGLQRQFIVHIKGPSPERGEFHVNLVLARENQLQFVLCTHVVTCKGVSSAPISLDSWHKVDATSDGQGNLVLTVDEVAYKNTITLSSTSDSSGDFTLGRHAAGSEEYDGQVREFQLRK
jgi:hypothetical protein